MRYISNRPGKQQQIMAKGPYRWVRHPLYLFLMVIIWSGPVLTLDRLLHYCPVKKTGVGGYRQPSV
jgi:protein-S-isoprenylcysteine O-methyltransferase Ste14